MTESKHTEQTLFKKRSEDLFSQTPAMMFDSKGTILELNDAAVKALGCSAASDLTGKTFKQAGFSVTDQFTKKLPISKQPWVTAAKTRSTVHNSITATVDPKGRHLWQQSTSMPLQKTERSKPHGTLTVFSDITELMQLQSRAIQSQKMDAVAALASGLTHDFNNILTSIRSAVQLLIDDTSPADPKFEQLKDIENETLRGAELIRQILLFTSPANGNHSRTYLNYGITQLRRLIRRTLPKNINIHFHLSEQEMMINLNPSRFEQVLLNLIINARDAMPSGGSIEITTSLITEDQEMAAGRLSGKNHLTARIDVADTGEGISPEHCQHIFEPFFSTKKKSGGTGLGLPIVHNIVHSCGGRISLDSLPGRGTTFSVFLPAKRCRKHSAPALARQNTSPTAGFETVLVIDDEPLITKSTARFLERYGYKALTAFNGKTALDIFNENLSSIAVVLLDMEMPDLSGRECLEQILKIKPAQKVIMLSGHILKDSDWHPVQNGACMFIQKPFDSAFLLQEIRKVLDK